MATSKPEDKFAFLFTGPTLETYLIDLENVFQTLTEYYNYPPSNISVVLGSIPAVAPSFPFEIIANAAELQTKLAAFAASASGVDKTALLYFTGNGVSPAGVAKLVLDGGDGSNSIDPTWLQTNLSAFSGSINVIMQQSFSGGFASAVMGAGLTQWSFTFACNETQESWGNNIEGSFFTHGWTRGLRLETLPAGAPDAGKHADQLGSVGASTDLLVSLQEAQMFGKQVHDQMGFGPFSTPGYNGSGPQYLGQPAFLIRDGFPWWESPDIILDHPNNPLVPPGDLYITDSPGATPPYNNTIRVIVWNTGTHPLRTYSLGIELFKTGAGLTNDKLTVCDKVPAGGILLPIDLADLSGSTENDATDWNTPFYVGTTHECVKAEAKLLCSDVDFDWSPESRDFEGQRNTDELTIVSSSPESPLPLRNLQGFVEHIYGLKNRFETPRRFIFAFPKNFPEYEKFLELRWFAIPEGRKAEVVPLKVKTEPLRHIPFVLKGGETKDILIRVIMKPEFKFEMSVRLPFEIMVEGERMVMAREDAIATHMPTFASIGGFTIVVRKGSATLKGTVLDVDNKPVVGARVFLRTIDDLQGAVLEADRKGRFDSTEINPNIYRVWAEAGGWRSKEQMTVLLRGEVKIEELQLTEEVLGAGKRVKVILDKIRIQNDHEPWFKGKGEMTFTAMVVPDGDESRKQVMRLPAQGEYKVSDKPGENELQLGITLFDGLVKNRALSIIISGKESDLFDPDDELKRYHRLFAGDPDAWYGQYSPSDEYLDKEDVGDWALWYRIVQA